MATKIWRVLPPLKRGGYTVRLRFLDEFRGERHFDSEFGIRLDPERPGRILMGFALDHRGYCSGPSAVSRLSGDLTPGTVFLLSARRWKQIGQPVAIDVGPVRVVRTELVDANELAVDLEPVK